MRTMQTVCENGEIKRLPVNKQWTDTDNYNLELIQKLTSAEARVAELEAQIQEYKSKCPELRKCEGCRYQKVTWVTSEAIEACRECKNYSNWKE